MKQWIFTFSLLGVCTSLAFSQGGHNQVSEGNELFAEQKFDEANNRYRDALLENPESPIVHFNIGDVLYKKKSYEEAIKSYKKALASDDIQLQAQSYYNMGNALYRMNKLPESIQAYEKALELNPNDEDAKYNLEYVRRKLKDNSEKQNQQNRQQNQQQSDQQQQQEGQQGKQNKEEKNQQGKQEQQQQNAEKNREQQPEQRTQEQKNSEQQNTEQQEQQAMAQQEISKEDAERILNALKNEEGELLKQRKPEARGRAYRGKDW